MKMMMIIKQTAAVMAMAFLLTPSLAIAQEFEDDVDDEVVAEEPGAPIDLYIPVLVAGAALIGYIAIRKRPTAVK